MWPQCWLCAVCAVGHIGCCGGGEYPVGVGISSSSLSLLVFSYPSLYHFPLYTVHSSSDQPRRLHHRLALVEARPCITDSSLAVNPPPPNPQNKKSGTQVGAGTARQSAPATSAQAPGFISVHHRDRATWSPIYIYMKKDHHHHGHSILCDVWHTNKRKGRRRGSRMLRNSNSRALELEHCNTVDSAGVEGGTQKDADLCMYITLEVSEYLVKAKRSRVC